jgi:hypothetical protein
MEAKAARESMPLVEVLLKTSEFLAWAKDHRESACHRWFKKAGGFDKQRMLILGQKLLAGRLLRRAAVFIHVEDVELSPLKCRVVESLHTDRVNGGGYRLARPVMESKSTREIMLDTCLQEIRALKQRWQHLAELGRLWREEEPEAPAA